MHEFEFDFCHWREASAWDAFVHSTRAPEVFASSTWFRTIESAFSCEIVLARAFASGTMVGAMPVLLKRRGGLAAAIPIPLSLYNGLLIAPEFDSESNEPAYHELVRVLLDGLRGVIDTGTFVCPPGVLDMRPFQWAAGWRTDAQFTYLVDLQTADPLDAAYSQALRRKLRMAEKSALVVAPSRDIAELVALHRKSYEAHARPVPFADEQVAILCTALLESGGMRILRCADADGRTLAARAFVTDGSMVYDLLAGRETDAGVAGASHFLVAKALEEFRGQGFARFDFMGANTPGIIDFKRAFGGALSAYFQCTFHRNSTVRRIVELRARVGRMGRQ